MATAGADMGNRIVLYPHEVRKQSILPAARLVSRVCDDIKDSAQRRVQVRTSKTRTNIRKQMRLTQYRAIGTVEAHTKYARLLHEGTPPHIILPRRKKYLSFYWKKIGQDVILGGVSHPGTSGSFFLTKPLGLYGFIHNFKVTLNSRENNL